MLQLPRAAFVLAVALTAPAVAQKSVLRSFERATAPARDAGTYHVATGTWTRGVTGASFAASPGAEIVYNCTVPSGYLANIGPGETWTASSGRVPSTTSPDIVWNPIAVPVGTVPGSAHGCQDSYHIDGFQISYCTRMLGANVSAQLAFYETWFPLCTSSTFGPPQGGPFLFTGLPGRSASAVDACWTMTFDLSSSSSSFDMLADGDGVYSGGFDDGFAFAFSFPSTTSSADQTRMRVAGCPVDRSGTNHPGLGWTEFPPNGPNAEAAGYDGTRFDGPAGALAPTFPLNGAVGLPAPAGEVGSDMLGDDAFRVEGGALVPPGCYYFGGPGTGTFGPGPYSNFHLELYANVACTLPLAPGTQYCGTTINPLLFPCPCANYGAIGHGCANSVNANGALLDATWTPGLLSTSTLVGSGMPNTSTAIYLKGSLSSAGGVPFGDGVRCVNGTLIRLGSVANAAGASQFPSPGGVTLDVRGQTPIGSGSIGYYQAYYRNSAATYCPPATFNVTSGYEIVW